MDGDTLLADLREEYETELSRLGSSKAIYALTGGEMTGDAVLAAVAEDALAAAEVFDRWAGEESNPDVGSVFESIATDAATHREATGVDPAAVDPATDRADYGTLANLESTPERLGGAVARSLVASQLLEQVVGFFVGDADPQTATTFRDVRDDLEDHLSRAVDVAEQTCANQDDREAVRTAAASVLDAAYDWYVETLESMGVKPKNVC